MTADRHSVRAARALAHLPEIDPAAAALALWCRHRDGGEPTHTQAETIFYGPEFDTLPLPEAVGLAAHHVLHVALRHSARLEQMRLRQGDAFDGELWTAAADGLINDLLLEGGHALPRPALRASEMVAHAFAKTLAPAETLRNWDCDRLYVELRRSGSGSSGDPASRATAYARAKDHSQDVMPQTGSSADETLNQDWDGRLRRALEAGRLAGTGIGTIGQSLAELAPARVPWEVHLRRLISRALLNQREPSSARPSRRWIAREADAVRAGQAQPGFEAGRINRRDQHRIVIALDTSGSISQDTLRLFASEAVGIARRLQAELHFIAFDTEVHETVSPLRRDLRRTLSETTFRQGGGTDFVPALAYAASLAPSATVVLTDLEGPTGDAPHHPVFWLCENPPEQPPRFGTVITAGS